MMKMLDVIRQLKSLEEYLGEDIPTEARHDDEETAEYRKDVEALAQQYPRWRDWSGTGLRRKTP